MRVNFWQRLRSGFYCQNQNALNYECQYLLRMYCFLLTATASAENCSCTEASTFSFINLKITCNSIHHIKHALLVKDGVPNLRNEDVEIVETNDTPPPVPDAPSRIPYATPIHEEEEDDTQSIHKSKYIEVIRIIILVNIRNITCFY